MAAAIPERWAESNAAACLARILAKATEVVKDSVGDIGFSQVTSLIKTRYSLYPRGDRP